MTDISLYFLFYDSPFYWVRAASLEDRAFTPQGIRVGTLFRNRSIPGDSLLVFNRYGTTAFFQKALKLLIGDHVPFVVDIDDVFWDLPSFSADPAKSRPQEVAFADSLLRAAPVATTPSPELAGALEVRHPHLRVFVIENCTPAWFAPPHGALIANTDSLKLPATDLEWFASLVHRLSEAGVSVEMIGENDNLLPYLRGMPVDMLPRLPYSEYLRHLASRSFRLGLVPVADGAYGNCKSAIKLVEFLSCGMRVIASDIAPYRRFKAEHPDLPLTIVSNRVESWTEAIEKYLASCDQMQLAHGRAVNDSLRTIRERQSAQWQQVANHLGGMTPDVALTARINRSLTRSRAVSDRMWALQNSVRRAIGS